MAKNTNKFDVKSLVNETLKTLLEAEQQAEQSAEFSANFNNLKYTTLAEMGARMSNASDDEITAAAAQFVERCNKLGAGHNRLEIKDASVPSAKSEYGVYLRVGKRGALDDVNKAVDDVLERLAAHEIDGEPAPIKPRRGQVFKALSRRLVNDGMKLNIAADGFVQQQISNALEKKQEQEKVDALHPVIRVAQEAEAFLKKRVSKMSEVDRGQFAAVIDTLHTLSETPAKVLSGSAVPDPAPASEPEAPVVPADLASIMGLLADPRVAALVKALKG